MERYENNGRKIVFGVQIPILHKYFKMKDTLWKHQVHGDK